MKKKKTVAKKPKPKSRKPAVAALAFPQNGPVVKVKGNTLSWPQ